MRKLLIFIVFSPLALAHPYFPDRHQWESIAAETAGFDAGRLQAAVDFAGERAVTEPTDMHQVITDSFAPREPDFRIPGPTRLRAGDAGMILRGGRIVAEWGDVHRVDMTFSTVKSYLAALENPPACNNPG